VFFFPADTFANTLLASVKPTSNTVQITLNKQLSMADINYIWITADVNVNAIEGHIVDVAVTSYVVSDGVTPVTKIPTATNPSGTQEIILASERLFLSEGNPNTVSCYRIPTICTAPNGTLIAACDQRIPSSSDINSNTNINTVIRRSTDNGLTWLPMQVVVDLPGTQGTSDPSLVVDTITKTVFLLYNWYDPVSGGHHMKLFYHTSTDNGATWSPANEITSQIVPAAWGYTTYNYITSGCGFQTKDGGLIGIITNNSMACMFGSTDHGQTWYVKPNGAGPGPNETKIIELTDGTLMVNGRSGIDYTRKIFTSTDGGDSWINQGANPEYTTITDPRCNAELNTLTSFNQGYDKSRYLFGHCNSGSRQNVTVKMSDDECKTWKYSKLINKFGGYIDLTVLSDGTIGVLYEEGCGWNDAIMYSGEIRFSRVSLDWLSDGAEVIGKQTINFSLVDSILLGTTPPTLVATTSGELNVTNFVSSDTNIIKIVGTNMILKDTGSCAITALFGVAIPASQVVKVYSISTGIKNNDAVSGIKIYPNPANSYVTIETKTKATVQIINIAGQTVKEVEINESKTNIDVSGLSKGKYFFKVIANSITKVFPIEIN